MWTLLNVEPIRRLLHESQQAVPAPATLALAGPAVLLGGLPHVLVFLTGRS